MFLYSKVYTEIEGEKMKKFIINKLFGRFNYEFEFKPDGLTILTGPNGYGKSTILRCIEALTNELLGLNFFISLDFETIQLFFEQEIVYIKKDNKSLDVNGIILNFSEFNDVIEKISLRRPYLSRIDENTLFDRRRGVRIDVNEYLEKYYKIDMDLDLFEADNIIKDDLLKQLKHIKNLIGNIYFIKEQRLIKELKNNRAEQEIENVINELPNRFLALMKNILSDYSAVSNKLDSSYPFRLFNNIEEISESDYVRMMDEMNKKFEKLNKYDLATMNYSSNVIFKKEHAKALKIYFDDFDEKYQIYKDFLNKLDIYTTIIDDRLSFKKIKITREKGISIVDSDNENKELNLNQLSSGEKQEIVLFYELIFGTKDNVTLLIDEPEISLHIVWQKKFMDDLLSIINYKHINAIVATHSPQIINNHWEMQIDLGELYGLQLDKM